jgi:hypothetical protein
MKTQTIVRTIKKEIVTHTEPFDVLTCFMATGVLLFISFVACSRLTLKYIHIPAGIGFDAPIYATDYGFPLPMVSILTPVGPQQTSAALWNQILGSSNVQILWAGLFLDFAVFFLVSFLGVYLYRRFIH